MSNIKAQINGADINLNKVIFNVSYFPNSGDIGVCITHKSDDIILELSLVEAAKLYSELFLSLKESIKDIDLTMNNMG